MLLVCPHCETAFQVDARAIGNGRTVRCAQCRGSWFAAPPVFAEPMAVASGMTEAAGETEPSAFEAAPVAGDIIEDVTEEVADSPPLAAEAPPEIVPGESTRAFKAPPPPVRKHLSLHRYRLPGPAAVAFVAMIVAAISALLLREPIVRLMPDLAGAYSTLGLPVNLRGLEFRNVKTKQETQDGIPVLVIEGEVVNVAKHPVEVPRVRIAVLGPAQQELYSWTTLLPRSVLGDGEKITFKSRLASPPPKGQEVLVRFLTRGDLTGNL